MFLTLKEKVWWCALFSRIFVLLLSAVSNFLIPDHSADAFIAPWPQNDVKNSYIDYVIILFFGGLVRWDAQYFLHISRYGYTFENCLAFFPLFPLLTRVVTKCTCCVTFGLLNDYSAFIISSISINLFCFVKSASLLYEISLRVLKSESLAYRSAILFCINPASVFFSAPYSESLFTYLSFYGMLRCGCGFKSDFLFICGLIFGLSTITRSNGVLNIGFILYRCLVDILDKIRSKIDEGRRVNIPLLYMLRYILPYVGIFSVPYFLCCMFTVFPFLSYQAYAYYKYCTSQEHFLPEFIVSFARSNNLTLPGEVNVSSNENHWCKHKLPLSYSYIQSHYWNVGFMQYYVWKQIPNFLLAAPVIFLILSGSRKYFRSNTYSCMRLGLTDPTALRKKYDGDTPPDVKTSFLAEGVFPYVIHVLFLTLFSCFYAHVQVTTRMISSSSPVLYWFCAEILHKNTLCQNAARNCKLERDLIKICKKKKKKEHEDLVRRDIEPLENMSSHWKVFVVTSLPKNSKVRFIHMYYILFTVIGTILFSNFLPWT